MDYRVLKQISFQQPGSKQTIHESPFTYTELNDGDTVSWSPRLNRLTVLRCTKYTKELPIYSWWHNHAAQAWHHRGADR